MIPLFATIGFRNRRNRGFRLWIPLFLAWLLLAPLVLLLLPVFFVLCRVGEVDGRRALATCWQVLAGLKNTYVEVAHEQKSILIHTF